MTRRFRFLAAPIAVALLATACGGDAVPDASEATSSDAPIDASTEVDATPTPSASAESERPEGEGGDPDAIFGVAVCEALRPVVLGDRAAGVDHARPFILDLLLPEPGYEPEAEDIVASEGTGQEAAPTCILSAGGDAWWEIALAGDGHVGQGAVGIHLRTSYSTPEDLDLAVEDATLAGDLCDGREPRSHDEVVVDGNHVAIVQCDFFAYQGEYELLFWSGYDLQPLLPEVWYDGSVAEQATIFGLPGSDGFSVENLERARGVGDCGTFSSWFVADDLTLDLAFATHRECEDSDGTADPYTWEQVYRGS